MERIQGLIYPSSPIKFYYEIGMRRFSIDILVQLLRIVRNWGHGYDHSFDTLERLCTFTTRLHQPILSLTFLK